MVPYYPGIPGQGGILAVNSIFGILLGGVVLGLAAYAVWLIL